MRTSLNNALSDIAHQWAMMMTILMMTGEMGQYLLVSKNGKGRGFEFHPSNMPDFFHRA